MNVCNCSLCTFPLPEVVKADATIDVDYGQVADHHVYELDGSLKYIELAHVSCAVADNDRRDSNYWRTP